VDPDGKAPNQFVKRNFGSPVGWPPWGTARSRRSTDQSRVALLSTLAAIPPAASPSCRTKRQPLGSFPMRPSSSYLSGYYASASTAGAAVTEVLGHHGGHGFSPDFPDAGFRSVVGPALPWSDLSVIDMRQILTLAQLMGVRLPSKAAPLRVRARP
jgi:hypothetical protein